MKRFVFVFFLVLLASCTTSPSESDIQTAIAQTQNAVPTHADTSLPTNTPSLAPTNTPGPTNTPEPTNTPKPTNTPRPTDTPTPIPEPLIFTGTGDNIVDLSEMWEGSALLHIIGPDVRDNFVVWSYDALGNQIDLLVNTIGQYDGYLMLNMGDEKTAILQIGAGGPWTVEVYPFVDRYLHFLDTPGVYEATGDDVFFFALNNAKAEIKSSNEIDNFVVWAWIIGSDKDLLVNEIGPYSGTVLIPPGTFMLEVKATGTWTIYISKLD